MIVICSGGYAGLVVSLGSLPVLLARSTKRAGLIHHSARSLDTRRRVRVVVTVLASGACTRPEWREMGIT